MSAPRQNCKASEVSALSLVYLLSHGLFFPFQIPPRIPPAQSPYYNVSPAQVSPSCLNIYLFYSPRFCTLLV